MANTEHLNASELFAQKIELLEYLLAQEGIAAPQIPQIAPRESANALPLSSAQQRLWFLDQLEPGSPLYNVPAAYCLAGSLDVTALTHSLSEIVRRHEVLRTTFATIDSQASQIIAPELTIPLPVVDLESLPQLERETCVRQLATQEAQRPFDLSRGPLVRATLLRLAAEKHVLLLTMHHIVSDGWSIGIFNRELVALYRAFCQGNPSPLPQLLIQYADFALWQQQWLQDKELKTQLVYWKAHLGDLPATLQLPTDRPRPATQGFQGAYQPFVLTKPLTEALKTLGRREGVTLFMTLLAAFKVLLHRYTAQEDIAVGTPIANRNRVEIEGLIGLFVNTLVMRTTLPAWPTFRELLRHVKETTLEAYAHQDLPFEVLVEKLQPERSLSHTPLFQVMFVFQNAPAEPLEMPDLTQSPIEIETGIAMFDLTLAMAEVDAGLKAALEYNLDLFDAVTIQRMLRHFQKLLDEVTIDPDCLISTLPLLTDAEQQQILATWNATQADYDPDATFCQLFETQVARTPDAVAVTFGDQLLTYHALNCRANQVAHHLQALGTRPESLMGIYIERSLDMVVGILGILKAGGAYLPMTPAYPQERLSFMLQDTQLPVLLTQQRLAENLPQHQVHLVRLDQDWPAIARQRQDNPAGQATPHSLAYAIYTSGSTGQPKGVLVTHQALMNHNHAIAKRYDLQPDDRVLQFAAISFDVSVEELFPSWLSGATVCLWPKQMSASLAEFLRHIGAEKLTVLNLPTPYWHQWASELASGQAHLPPCIRLVVVGSEQALPERLTLWRQSVGAAVRWCNAYGLTETTITTTIYEPASGAETETPYSVPIGRPIANVQFYALDAHLRPLPVGVPGELYIGGSGIAQGYLKRPALTAGRFLPDPFSRQPGARLYHTGDLARYLLDGNVEFLGRADDQVKIRGFRIEPGEIAAVLAEHPAVQEAAVLALEDASAAKRLVAYLVLAPQQASSIPDLRHFLQARLPDYMIPSTYLTLDALPRTASGKIDRRALPAPDPSRPDWEGLFVAPGDPLEEMLAAIWAQVLGLAQVGVHDNFFELGGHSLLATQIISRIRQAFQVELPLSHIFEIPSVKGLAESIRAAYRSQQPSPILRIQPLSGDGPLPLSSAQQRLWFLDQLEPHGSQYNIPLAVRLSGALDVPAWQHSMNEIVRRHHVLRATFATVQDQPVQVIAPYSPLPLPLVDLQSLPEGQRTSEAHRLAGREARQPFDLACGPLLRQVLLRLGEQHHVLLLTTHHIVSDGWSHGVFIGEMVALYTAFCTGRPSPLSELPLQYTDFAAWQRQWLRGEALATQLSYWRQQLDGAPATLDLPTDRPRPAIQTSHGATIEFALSPALSAELEALSRKESGTLFMTLLAAFKVLLSRYTGQEDISIGTPIANRNHTEIEDLIGFFVNTLVLRTDLSGNPTFQALLARVRQVALDAYIHQDLPFEKLVEELQPRRDLSHTPLFQAMFILQNAPKPALELAGLTLSPLALETRPALFDLTLAMEERPDSLRAALEYNTDLFDCATATRMVTHLETLLQNLATRPEQRLSDLSLLTDAEQQQLLIAWNDTALDHSPEENIPRLLETQAVRSPDAIATLLPDTAYPAQLTYCELNRRANQLAHYLRALGVSPETRVGLLMERSLEMLVGLLGVLKAGGAYVPLDPMYPQERLAFMLADTAAPVLLTQGHLMPYLSVGEKTVFCLDRDWQNIAQAPQEDPASEALPDNPAYVIYTSGSTGQPKGVLITHSAIVQHCHRIRQHYQLVPDDRVLQFASFNFDASLEQILPALIVGATVVLRDAKVWSPADLWDQVLNLGLTVINLPPAYWHQSIQEQTSRGKLRLAIVGGDVVQPQSLHLWLQTPMRHTCLLNAYGPTETTITTMLYKASDDQTWREIASVPIGRPLANAQIYLLDAHLRPAPVSVPGELYIGGDGLARGYLHRPALTADCFVPHPFNNTQPGKRLYKTGDLARHLPDGNVQFLGRQDHQVKIRGFRIELGEIEAALRQHPAVAEAVSIVREDTQDDRRLVTYVVPQATDVATSRSLSSDLRRYLKDKLPEYMLPSAIVTLEALPRLPSDKVDRQALPAPERADLALQDAFVAPRTPVEETLAAIWAQVLGVDQVGIHDNFFDLGGHSLLATQVNTRLHQTLQVTLPLRSLFEMPTVAELAEHIIQTQIEQTDSQMLAQMLAELESLTPGEVRNLLAGNGSA